MNKIKNFLNNWKNVYLVIWFLIFVGIGFWRRESIFGSNPTSIDIILFSTVVVILLIPLSEEIKVWGVNFKQRLNKVETYVLRGEVVKNESGSSFYIDKEGYRHLLPQDDNTTAQFLQSQKGELSISNEKLSSFPDGKDLQSVLKGRLLKEQKRGTVFVILNEKKYYINSWADIYDWERENDVEETTVDDLKKYPTGR